MEHAGDLYRDLNTWFARESTEPVHSVFLFFDRHLLFSASIARKIIDLGKQNASKVSPRPLDYIPWWRFDINHFFRFFYRVQLFDEKLFESYSLDGWLIIKRRAV